MDKHNVLIVSTLNSLPITMEILKLTKVGKTVNDIAKSTSDSKLKYEASALVLKWKNLVNSQKKPKVEEPLSSGL